MRRPIALLLAVSAILPLSASAQEGRSIWTLLDPNLLAQRVLQSGIGLLRTQMDLTYSDLKVDFWTGSIALTDARAWPLPDWDEEGICEIGIDRITIRSGAIDVPERVKLKAQLIGTSFPTACLPPDARAPFDAVGLTEVEMPRLTIDLDYGFPQSDAIMRAYTQIDGLVAADLTTTMTYVWFDGREDLEEPIPVIFIESASLSLEDLGLWERLSEVLPPAVTEAGGLEFVAGAVEGAIRDMNGSGASELSDGQSALLASVREIWPSFVDNPATLVLETDIDGDAFFDVIQAEDDPGYVFDTLQPRLRLAPARATDMVSLDLLRQAMSDGITAMGPDELREVGAALITGYRAPRNLSKGVEILSDLADSGDGAAALLLSEAMETRVPEQAYLYALRAGAAGEDGAAARLDRLERRLPFGRVLELQEEVMGDSVPSETMFSTLTLVRSQAAGHLDGTGLPRSYPRAALFAMIASAAGDPEGQDILAQIDEVVRLAEGNAIAEWSAYEDAAAELAMNAWIEMDLPSALAAAPENVPVDNSAPREGRPKLPGKK